MLIEIMFVFFFFFTCCWNRPQGVDSHREADCWKSIFKFNWSDITRGRETSLVVIVALQHLFCVSPVIGPFDWTVCPLVRKGQPRQDSRGWRHLCFVSSCLLCSCRCWSVSIKISVDWMDRENIFMIAYWVVFLWFYDSYRSIFF